MTATAALVAAVAMYVGLTLPRPPLELDAVRPATHMLGGYHVHTTRSDGTGAVADVAAAARRAGLSFVILTDHGDATRTPDAPAYIDDVLVIDAVEINSREGHIVALGLNAASPYPLAGLARDVIDDVHRLGGVAVVAHPDSPRPSLGWRGMNQRFDGIEWINADSEWRDDSTFELVGAAARSLIRPAESVASLFRRPVRSLARWDNAARTRPVFGLAALDAHARIGWGDDEEPRQGTAFERPSYESLFRTLGTTVVLEEAPSGDATRDGAAVLDAIRRGRTYSVVRTQAEPATLLFAAEREGVRVPMGSRLEAGAPVALVASVDGAPGARVVMYRGGAPLANGLGRVTVPQASAPGVYRAEAFLPGSDLPWIVSNPIAIAPEPAAVPAPPGFAPPPARPESLVPPLAGARWVVETDPISKAVIVGGPDRIGLSFTLSARPPHGQYAALVLGGDDAAGIDQIAFVGTASRPMRVSVQVRLPGGKDGQRWAQSVYLDQTPREVVLRMPDFEPVGLVTSRRPNVAPIQSLLFVVDTVNARPGWEGTMWVSQLSLRVDRLELPVGPATPADAVRRP